MRESNRTEHEPTKRSDFDDLRNQRLEQKRGYPAGCCIPHIRADTNPTPHCCLLARVLYLGRAGLVNGLGLADGLGDLALHHLHLEHDGDPVGKKGVRFSMGASVEL